MFKKLLCFFLVFLSFYTCFSVCAEGEFSAFLSDVSCEKNRLFETTLSVNTQVSAFVAILEFDQNKVEFKEAKALSENSEISINTNDQGKVKLAFVNKFGTQDEVISFTLKAKAENTFIALTLEQVIDQNANDILLKNVKGADVAVIPKADNISESKKENPKQQKSEKETSATALNEDKGSQNISVPAKENSNTRKIIFISSGAVLLLAVSAMGFILGRNSNNKNRKN